MTVTSAGNRCGDGAQETYEAIASVYDDFTAHHDYEGWMQELLPALERRDLRKGRVLDVGCGTGKSFIPLLERGWEVTACDISPAMVELARQKVGGRADLSVADMRDLPLFGRFELVMALDDAVNYLLSVEELERSLRGMRANLAPHGLLLFDVNELLAYRTFFAETVTVERESAGDRLVWHGKASPQMEPGTICEAHLGIETAEGTVREDGSGALGTHRQRHFPKEEICGALERAGLECLDLYGMAEDGILRQPLDQSIHTKAVYISRAVSKAQSERV